jgi:hypothetical protein
MSKWMRQAGQWLLIGMLLVSMGGHLAVLQTVAWSRMLVDFSTKDSLTVAVEKTFDGEHPCPLCKVVKQTKEKEKQDAPLVKSELKWNVTLPAGVDLPAPRFTDMVILIPEYSGRFARVYLAVPMQPPRV